MTALDKKNKKKSNLTKSSVCLFSFFSKSRLPSVVQSVFQENIIEHQELLNWTYLRMCLAFSRSVGVTWREESNEQTENVGTLSDIIQATTSEEFAWYSHPSVLPSIMESGAGNRRESQRLNRD
jgi:hypothetical protein